MRSRIFRRLGAMSRSRCRQGPQISSSDPAGIIPYPDLAKAILAPTGAVLRLLLQAEEVTDPEGLLLLAWRDAVIVEERPVLCRRL